MEKTKKNDELELEPNFPGVATPQSSVWIICITSYTYDPSTAPWGAFLKEVKKILLNKLT